MTLDEAINEYKQLAEWLTELKERREADRWIPVTERLPNKEGVKCLVTTDYGDVCEDKFVSGVFVLNRGGVIAWKPMPEAYKPFECVKCIHFENASLYNSPCDDCHGKKFKPKENEK